MRDTKKPLEKEIQNEILEWLDKREIFFWRCNNIPVFSKSNDGHRRFRSLPKYTPRGLPDIIIIHKRNFIAIEVKRPGGKIRPEQLSFGDRVEANGGHYFIVTSLNEMTDIWGSYFV